MNLFRNCTVKRLKVDGTNYTAAAGSTAVTSEAVDCLGYQGVAFIVGFGALVTGAVTSYKVRSSSLANVSDAADVASSSQAVVDSADNKGFLTDIFMPYERYVDIVISRATQNATVDCLFAVLYGASDTPVAVDATMGAIKFLNGTAEGVA